MDTGNRTVFLIGNGTSRRGFLLSRLRDRGILIGCNQAYRDYADFSAVVTIDVKASKFAEKEFKGLHIFNNCFKTPHIYLGSLSYQWGDMPTLQEKMDSGKLAAHMAADFFKADRLILIGVDFGGEDLYTEHTFKPRPHYREDWNTLFERFQEVYRVGEPTEACEGLNLKQITYSELEDLICE